MNLEGANILETVQLVLFKLHAKQKHSFEETEKKIAERTHRLDKNRASYPGLSKDLQKSEFNTKSTEMVIDNDREAITNVQALLEKNE